MVAGKPSARDARLTKALAEVRYVQTLLGPHLSAESTLADEVIRMRGVVERIRVMIKSWREVAGERRKFAAEWRTKGESFAWHAIRADDQAAILETQATLLESLLGPP